MLGNCEKMVVISSTTNEWPQEIDERSMMMPSNGIRVMEKSGRGQEQQVQQQILKCPRCDSSNTKFCYYNNYSLSQPRHFCKACKRYWTRGGTLRNVPVGGGCRKNKRVRKSSSGSIDGPSAPCVAINPPSQPQFDSSRSYVSPLFYGLGHATSEINLPFSRASSVSGYNLQPQMNSVGLGFTSGMMSSNDNNNPNLNSLLSSYSLFGSSSSTPTIASLLASNFQQQKYQQQMISPFENFQISRSDEAGINMKDVKQERGQNRMDWNQMEQIGLSDPSIYWNNATTSVGAWNDPSNVGSSVTSLF